MALTIIDVLNPDEEEKVERKETPDTKEETPKRARRFVRQQVINIDGQIVDAP